MKKKFFSGTTLSVMVVMVAATITTEAPARAGREERSLQNREREFKKVNPEKCGLGQNAQGGGRVFTWCHATEEVPDMMIAVAAVPAPRKVAARVEKRRLKHSHDRINYMAMVDQEPFRPFFHRLAFQIYQEAKKKNLDPAEVYLSFAQAIDYQHIGRVAQWPSETLLLSEAGDCNDTSLVLAILLDWYADHRRWLNLPLPKNRYGEKHPLGVSRLAHSSGSKRRAARELPLHRETLHTRRCRLLFGRYRHSRWYWQAGPNENASQ